MNNLEKIFREHKESLDSLEPNENTWGSIISEINEQEQTQVLQIKSKRLSVHFLKIAIIFVALVGLSSVFLFQKKTNQAEIYYSLKEASENKSLITPQGTPSTFDLSRNKYTLIQFWSSGNALCVEESCYYYLPAYEKFNGKGFEIYAVSLDSEMASWVSGIEENELPWNHASDLKGLKSPICTECNISKVPASFLLNHNGELIAKDVEAEYLEKTLEELFAEN